MVDAFYDCCNELLHSIEQERVPQIVKVKAMILAERRKCDVCQLQVREFEKVLPGLSDSDIC